MYVVSSFCILCVLLKTVNKRMLMQLSDNVVQDEEVLHSWLVGLHLEDCYHMFVVAGYDMPTISRMTPEVQTALYYISRQIMLNIRGFPCRTHLSVFI